jgi:hypothetical protein
LDDKVEIFKESFNNYKFNNSTFFYFYRSLWNTFAFYSCKCF